MSLLSGPPYPPSELDAIRTFITDMRNTANKLSTVVASLDKQSPAHLSWEGKAANEYAELLNKQREKVKAAHEAAIDAVAAARKGLDEAQRINSEWQAAVKAYLDSQKESGQ